MNRRENLKLLLTGASGILLAGCGVEDTTSTDIPKAEGLSAAGRSPEELALDAKLHSTTFFTPEEKTKLDYLVEVIIPKDDKSGGALEAGVPDFIEFMMKDLPANQTHMRGGLQWLDNHAKDLHDKAFMELSDQQRIAIIDEIAYPESAKPEVIYGVRFFNLLRDLTATGYFTSRIGFADLEYVGNSPNIWNGVPDHVLAKYNLSYDESLMPIYLRPEDRGVVAKWDDEGNLIG
ncbi:gluconate 2-dehydrogenase subunit 3 family protein [Anditalea andensis]|uniref:Transcriptional initiation protein Tat n=1 Tax=Anditalea andensis TaxID=1048983 RepID=A0A074KZZ4_9BACT|nr:gluconate 2-dehydrogenase subunit 3 family protein [Anditalea andensis]KEO75556.1 transcriptional initiation protein Tat [Anditalea andensis]